MFLIGPRDVSMLLAAGGPREWLAGVGWPLHRALLELREHAREQGSDLPYGAIQSQPHPDVGLKVLGVDSSITALAEDGLIELHGDGLTVSWRCIPDRLVGTRRDLMRLAPQDVELIHRAGRRWGALAATSLKNWRAASVSLGAMVASGTPNRRQLALAGR